MDVCNPNVLFYHYIIWRDVCHYFLKLVHDSLYFSVSERSNSRGSAAHRNRPKILSTRVAFSIQDVLTVPLIAVRLPYGLHLSWSQIKFVRDGLIRTTIISLRQQMKISLSIVFSRFRSCVCSISNFKIIKDALILTWTTWFLIAMSVAKVLGKQFIGKCWAKNSLLYTKTFNRPKSRNQRQEENKRDTKTFCYCVWL